MMIAGFFPQVISSFLSALLDSATTQWSLGGLGSCLFEGLFLLLLLLLELHVVLVKVLVVFLGGLQRLLLSTFATGHLKMKEVECMGNRIRASRR